MIIGVDIGGTATKFGLFSMEGELIEKWSIDTVIEEEGEKIIPNVAASILSKLEERKMEKEEIVAVGMGVPCPITKKGVIERSVNLRWKTRRNVCDELEKLIGIRTFGGNDANLAALGEAYKGAARGRENVVMVTLGTGVGGGIICNGHLLFGAHGVAGEIGHMHTVDRDDLVCNCGAFGCLEQVSSATGIVRMAKEVIGRNDSPSLLRQGPVTAKLVFDAYKQNDELAGIVVDKFAKYLARELVNISMVVDPDIFVIGGGVSAAGEELLKPVIRYYKEYMSFSLCDNNEFVIATLGNDAGIFGAAKLALSNIQKKGE